jgi:transposase
MKFISDMFWSEIKDLFLTKKTKVGRPEFDNRTALEGIFYVLYSKNH